MLNRGNTTQQVMLHIIKKGIYSTTMSIVGCVLIGGIYSSAYAKTLLKSSLSISEIIEHARLVANQSNSRLSAQQAHPIHVETILPIIGLWRLNDAQLQQCHELYNFKPDGQVWIVSNQERTMAEFQYENDRDKLGQIYLTMRLLDMQKKKQGKTSTVTPVESADEDSTVPLSNADAKLSMQDVDAAKQSILQEFPDQNFSPIMTMTIQYENNKEDCFGNQVDQKGSKQIQFVKFNPNQQSMLWCSSPSICPVELKRVLP